MNKHYEIEYSKLKESARTPVRSENQNPDIDISEPSLTSEFPNDLDEAFGIVGRFERFQVVMAIALGLARQ